MSLLDWFPFDPAAMKERLGRVSVEEYGAMLLVCGEAWRDPIPCTIEDTDAALDYILGSRWRKLEAVVRRHFTPCDEHPGRLRCTWLWTLYEKQLALYQAKRRGGVAGGTAPTAAGKRRGRPPKPRPTVEGSAANSGANSTENSTAIPAAIAESKGAVPPVVSRPGGEQPPAAVAGGAGAARAESAPLAPTAAAERGGGAPAARRQWRGVRSAVPGSLDAAAVDAALVASAIEDAARAGYVGAPGDGRDDADSPTPLELAQRWIAEQPDSAEREAAIRRRAEALVGAEAAHWRLHAAIEAETVGEHMAHREAARAAARQEAERAERRRRRGLDVVPSAPGAEPDDARDAAPVVAGAAA